LWLILLATAPGNAVDFRGDHHCPQPLAQRLSDAALRAPEAAKDDGSLYGMQRWYGTTKRSYVGLRFPGLLSCAYTVSAIFKEACHPIGKIASVKGIEQVLSGWRKVTDAQKLKPGDVIFWSPVRGSVLGIACPGHWHVGISIGGDRTVDNNWWSGKPTQGKLGRSCTKFAYARRSPK